MAGNSNDLGLDREAEKAYSTFYTKSQNALLLASLAVGLPNPAWKLDDPAFFREFKAVDFACGGGMLLRSSCRAMEARMRATHVAKGIHFDAEVFYRDFITNGCFGFDVMPEAVEMTRRALSSLQPATPPGRFHLYHAPLEPPDSLGSLDLLKDKPASRTLRDVANVIYSLVIMNPPFARSCGDNLQFGTSLEPQDRMALDRVLTGLRRDRGMQGIGQAGQAADFMVLALEKLAPGGRLAFIVPKSLVDGAAWLKLRRYLLSRASVEMLVFTFTPPGFSFSENTSLSECMVVARKKEREGDDHSGCLVVNLLVEPRDDAAASGLASQLAGARIEPGPSHAMEITDPVAGVMGNAFVVPRALLDKHVINWQQLLGLPSPRLHEFVMDLIERGAIGRLMLPLARLGSIGSIGPDRSELTKNTDEATGGTPGELDFVWGRDNDTMRSMCIDANQRRSFKARATSSTRKKFRATRSHLLLPESLFLKTTSIFGYYCRDEVLSNVSWSCKAGDNAEKIITLWSNSTLGIVLLLAVRNEARGPWIHWKKATLVEYRVPDPARLPPDQVAKLLGLFDKYKDTTFQTIFDAGDIRQKLDENLAAILCPGAELALLKEDLGIIRDLLR
nr:hypothetical protein [Candidatus Sigynarchaeota archaeon]